MVCKPLDWEHPKEELDKCFDLDLKKPYVLSDMRGGYLSTPTINMYTGLLSSNNLRNFNIELHDFDLHDEMVSILNGLQKQGFKINKKVLDFVKNNRQTLENEGLLMKGILAHVNLKEAFDLMRKSYYINKDIKGVCSLDSLLKELGIRAQKARYEDFIIRLVSAYEDYVFYLPAFMDFRGRIYRCGILHFHERDLARSFIEFADNQEEGCKQSVKDIVAISAAFKYKKFYDYDDALQWYKDNHNTIYASDQSLICFAKSASDPFQFIAKVLSKDDVQEYDRIPISQDAAASAYQIMSYLLLNEEMARRTNLIPHTDGKIQDVYTCILKDLKTYLYHQINDKSKIDIIESKLDRKLIKILFMPLIYGKTLNSMENDIRQRYGQLINVVEELISRIGSTKARSENNMNEPLDDFRNLKTWLTRACQNAEDETKGRLPIRNRIWKALVRGAEQEGKIGSRTVGQRKGEVLIPGRSRMTRECHVRFLREGCDTTTYQARRAVHGAASLLTWSMHIALSRRLAAYPRSSHFQEDPRLDLV
ncbi:UNVERIFIED_CONTAM: putative DNA-directed RNA polymerase [Sesamum calycinum]|uniref:DNA-directed RNA polymerase n=1 Tax=Sesamum calycinum TaxID=2727403 RepID=A0AAW2K7X2_9LAMI